MEGGDKKQQEPIALTESVVDYFLGGGGGGGKGGTAREYSSFKGGESNRENFPRGGRFTASTGPSLRSLKGTTISGGGGGGTSGNFSSSRRFTDRTRATRPLSVPEIAPDYHGDLQTSALLLRASVRGAVSSLGVLNISQTDGVAFRAGRWAEDTLALELISSQQLRQRGRRGGRLQGHSIASTADFLACSSASSDLARKRALQLLPQTPTPSYNYNRAASSPAKLGFAPGADSSSGSGSNSNRSIFNRFGVGGGKNGKNSPTLPPPGAIAPSTTTQGVMKYENIPGWPSLPPVAPTSTSFSLEGNCEVGAWKEGSATETAKREILLRPLGAVWGLLRASGGKNGNWTTSRASTFSSLAASSFQPPATDTPPPPPPPPPPITITSTPTMEDAAAAADYKVYQICPASNPRVRYTVQVHAGSGAIYLTHIDYSFALLPKARHTLPLDPHLFASLAAHPTGVSLLKHSHILPALLTVAFGTGNGVLVCETEAEEEEEQGEHTLAPLLQRRAALWALGAISSHPVGFNALCTVDPSLPLRLDAASRGLHLRVTCEREGGDNRKHGGDCAVPTPHHRSWRACPESQDDTMFRAAAFTIISLTLAGFGEFRGGGSREGGGAALASLGWKVPLPHLPVIPLATTRRGAVLNTQAGVLCLTLHPGVHEREAALSNGGSALLSASLAVGCLLSRAGGTTQGDAYKATNPNQPLAPLPPPHYLAATTHPRCSSPSSSAGGVGTCNNCVLEEEIGGDGDTRSSTPLLPFLTRCTSVPTLQKKQCLILDKIMELASKVTMKEARNALQKLKAENHLLFATSSLYARVHALLSRYTLTLPVRRFVHALFDKVSYNDKNWGMLVGGSSGSSLAQSEQQRQKARPPVPQGSEGSF